MLLPTRLLLMVVLSLSATACVKPRGGALFTSQGLAAAGRPVPGAGGSVVSNNGGAVRVDYAGRLVGRVSVPSTQLISDKGAGVLSNNGGAILSNNGSSLIANNSAGLIGNNAGSYRVAYAESTLVPLQGGRVEVFTLDGRKASELGVVTDAKGDFSFPKGSVSDLRAPLRLKVSFEHRGFTLTLSALTTPLGDTGGFVAVNPATTLLTKRLESQLAAGKLAPAAIDLEAFVAQAAALAPFMSDVAMVVAIAATPTQAATAYDLMTAASPALAEAMHQLAPHQAAAAPPASSGGSGGSGGGSGTPSFEFSTASHYTLVRVAGADFGGNTPGTDPLSAHFGRLSGLATAPDGTIFVADRALNQIRRIRPGQPTEVLAGSSSGTAGFVGDGTPATAALLNQPTGLVYDAAADVIFFCDTGNNRVRYFSPGGRIETYAGGGSDFNSAVAVATEAQLLQPFGLAADEQGNLYFSDPGSGRVSRVTPSGALSSIMTTSDPVQSLAVDGPRGLAWFSSDGIVRVIRDIRTAPTLDPTPVFVAPGNASGRVVRGLACDQQGTLFVLASSNDADALEDTRIWRQAVGSAGQALSGRPPEDIAGTGALGASAGDYRVPTTPLANAATQLLPGLTACGLYLDMHAAASPTVQAGQLYMSGNYNDGTDAFGHVLRFDPAP